MKFFVGTYTDQGGPGVCLMEARDQRLTMLSSTSVIHNPIYLTLSADKTALYASASLGPGMKGAAASFRFENGTLSPLCLQPAGGDEACHCLLSAEEELLYTANYMSGNVSVFPVHDGYIFPKQQVLRHAKGGSGAVPERQEASHTHQCAFRPGTQELFVCDLGRDEIVIYGQGEESGLLIRKDIISVPAGSGPRHILFLGSDRFLLVCELGDTLIRYELTNERWTLTQTVSTLPGGCGTPSFAAAIRRHGDRVYVSNRGYNSVAVFDLAPDGALSQPEFILVQGSYPRDILVFGASDILCANQLSGTVEWIQNGRTIAAASVPQAVCLLAAE